MLPALLWELPREVLNVELTGDPNTFLNNFAHRWRRAKQLGVKLETHEQCLFCVSSRDLLFRDPHGTGTDIHDSGTTREEKGPSEEQLDREQERLYELSPCLMCDGRGSLPPSLPIRVTRSNIYQTMEFLTIQVIRVAHARIFDDGFF